MQSGVLDSQIDPKSMHNKFPCSKLYFYFLIAFNVFTFCFPWLNAPEINYKI